MMYPNSMCIVRGFWEPPLQNYFDPPYYLHQNLIVTMEFRWKHIPFLISAPILSCGFTSSNAIDRVYGKTNLFTHLTSDLTWPSLMIDWNSSVHNVKWDLLQWILLFQPSTNESNIHLLLRWSNKIGLRFMVLDIEIIFDRHFVYFLSLDK